jgi:hypothetical protein
MQLEVPIERNGEFSDGKETTAVERRKRPLRVGRPLPQNRAEDRSCNHAGQLMVTASIAGTHLGSGGSQFGSPLAQDLRLIRTWSEKSVGCDYRGIYLYSLRGTRTTTAAPAQGHWLVQICGMVERGTGAQGHRGTGAQGHRGTFSPQPLLAKINPRRDGAQTVN